MQFIGQHWGVIGLYLKLNLSQWLPKIHSCWKRKRKSSKLVHEIQRIDLDFIRCQCGKFGCSDWCSNWFRSSTYWINHRIGTVDVNYLHSYHDILCSNLPQKTSRSQITSIYCSNTSNCIRLRFQHLNHLRTGPRFPDRLILHFLLHYGNRNLDVTPPIHHEHFYLEIVEGKWQS